ncbi:MAG: hypothetical protein RQ783_06130 [Gammaproteobacteria bacterium]|nr:hypothetical protein [Gammaproteobacteria bacterium]
MSEIMPLVIGFHTSNQRDLKHYYLGFAARFYIKTRFWAVMPKALIPLCTYFTHIKEKRTGISFVDSTSIKVCHKLRNSIAGLIAYSLKDNKPTSEEFGMMTVP